MKRMFFLILALLAAPAFADAPRLEANDDSLSDPPDEILAALKSYGSHNEASGTECAYKGTRFLLHGYPSRPAYYAVLRGTGCETKDGTETTLLDLSTDTPRLLLQDSGTRAVVRIQHHHGLNDIKLFKTEGYSYWRYNGKTYWRYDKTHPIKHSGGY